MRDQGPCACDGFVLWYVDLAGVEAAVRDEVVCECGHPTDEHVAGVGRCLGEVVVTW